MDARLRVEMESTYRAPRGTRWHAVALIAVAAATVAGCGSDSDYKNKERPAAALVVSASINNQRVNVSPHRFGGGPITLVITNQSSTKQQVTLESDGGPGSGPGTRPVQTGPINPRETASVKADVTQGRYALKVDGDGVAPARLEVGRDRPSSQNQLLQP
jgi:hypothetical protein